MSVPAAVPAPLLPFGSTAVMASRREPADSAEFFPTAPWATRALFRHVLPLLAGVSVDAVWEPCAGEGHMAAVCDEFTPYPAYATDLYDYGYGKPGVDFLERTRPKGEFFCITNPPFKRAAEMALHALTLACGVAFLCRTQWIEGGERYADLFSRQPPALIAPFVERVPMTRGRWDPGASTATSYTWFVWSHAVHTERPSVVWIPPGCKQALTKPDDRARFAAWSLHPQDDAELERIAREFCEPDGSIAADAPVAARLHATLTYAESRLIKPEELGRLVTVPQWQARRRDADDLVARRLTNAALRGAALMASLAMASIDIGEEA